MTSEKIPHEWSKDALLNKAKRYADVMHSQDRNNWQFGVWSALTLEILARATLANISPILVADNKDWNNIFYALGNSPNKQKFIPKSVNTSFILSRIENLMPEFTREMFSFAVTHAGHRNSEFHSGALPFDGLSTSEWLAIFYVTCQTLLESMDEDLAFLFGEEEAGVAETLIKALRDKTAKSVAKTVTAYTTTWGEMTSDEQEKLQKQAAIFASRKVGHRVVCPACGSSALVQGSPIKQPIAELEDDVIVERQPMLPSSFECIACGLKISGYSRLSACGLGDSFTDTSHYDPVEFFEFEQLEEPQWEPDFNEY